MADISLKKINERKVFDLVYGDRSLNEVKEFEAPDFLVRNAPDEPLFGVEVTDYFLSEANARLENINGYIGHLISGGEYKHKDDRMVLKIGKVDIQKNDGTVHARKVPAIIQDIPLPRKCARDIADRILTKARCSYSHKENLLHVNLIINDKSKIFGNINKKDFYRVFFIPELIEALSKTHFREIFFITSIQNEHVYIPLKTIHLLAELFMFNGAIVQNNMEEKIPPEIEFVELFGSYLSFNAPNKVLINRDLEGTEAIFGDSGVLLSNDDSVTVRFHQDYVISPDAFKPNIEWASILGEAFDEVMNEYRMSHNFETEAFFPVNKSLT